MHKAAETLALAERFIIDRTAVIRYTETNTDDGSASKRSIPSRHWKRLMPEL